MTRTKPTVADLRARKGKGQYDDAARHDAGRGRRRRSRPASTSSRCRIDLVTHPRYREVAPTLFSMTGQTHLEAGTRDDYLRWACKVMLAGADAVYCSGGLGTVEHVAREHIPVVGHVGLVPSRATWTGGMKAVAKTAKGAMALLDEVRAYEAAGAFAVEIEVVPVEVATEISRRVGILLWSMGAGAWLRCAIPVRRGHSRHQPWPHAAPFQGLSQLRRRIRPPSGRTRRGLQGIHRRRRIGGLSRGQARRQNGRRRAGCFSSGPEGRLIPSSLFG